MTLDTTVTQSPSDRFRPDLILVDGRHLLYRATDVHRLLEAEVDGKMVATGGVYGLLSVLAKLRRRFPGRYMMAWEGSNNFRYKLFPGYKKRGDQSESDLAFREELNKQEVLARRILSLLGVRQYEADGGEADDVLGTLAARGEEHGLKVAIFTGDSDLQQLINDNVRVIKPERKQDKVYDEAAVVDRWGVSPSDIPLLKALMGDSSDGIPGVPKIGEKTAAKLIQTHGSCWEDIENAVVQPERFAFSKATRENLLACREYVPLYLKLTTIRRDMKLKPDEPNKDPVAARKMMATLKFRRLLEGGMFSDLNRLAP